MTDFVAIDFETANEKRRSACSIGLVRFVNGVVAERYSTLLRPHDTVNYFNPVNTWVHGLTAADVANAPQWGDVAADVAEFIADAPLVAHNMAFDGYVLTDLSELYGTTNLQNRKFCTLRLARRILATELQRKSLNNVYGYYFPGETFAHHEATADAEACGRVFARMQQDYSYAELEELCPVPGTRRSSDGPSAASKQTAAELIAKYGTNKEALLGERVAITGTLMSGQRAAIQELITATGGIPENTLTKHTTLLVVGIPDPKKWSEGSSASRKLVKASQLRENGSPLEVITEEELFRRFE